MGGPSLKSIERALKDYEFVLGALEAFHQDRTVTVSDRGGDLRVTAAILVLAARVDETDTTLDQLLPQAGRGS